jgi:CheY-like chemotaxis protein
MARIIIVDDDRYVRDVLRLFLKGAGHDVVEASNGAEGICAFQRQSSDLLFCDLHMPVKGGLETIRELRRDFPDAKIIAMTGAGPDAHQDEYPLGDIPLLSKPFRMHDVLEILEQALGRLRPRRS